MAIPTLQEQLAAVKAAEAGVLPTASSGQIAVAQDDAPTTLQQDINNVDVVYKASQGAENSAYVSTNGAGTGSTLSTTSSQATSDAGVIPASDVNRDRTGTINDVANPSTSAGVGAASDDNTGPSKNTTQQTINSNFNAPIVAQPNQLDQYVSYTYSISWYMLTPNQFKGLKSSRNTAGWELLMQSGGAGISPPTPQQAGRNRYFGLDYYMDNLTIKTKTMKATNMAHNATEISFTVTEPNGITLLQNLYNAVSDLWKQNPTQYNPAAKPNYIQNPYCLVIRFYGYDDKGNLVYPAKGQANASASPAVIEKYYPFLLVDLTFKVVNKAIEYNIKGKPLPYSVNLSQNRGTIPFNYEFVGATVNEVLNGSTVAQGVNTADPGARQSSTQPTQASAAPQPAVNNQVNTLPTPDNASNAYVESTGVDYANLSG